MRVQTLGNASECRTFLELNTNFSVQYAEVNANMLKIVKIQSTSRRASRSGEEEEI